MRSSLTLALAAASLAFSLPATAQAPTAAQQATFKVNDKNKDGKLDKAEFAVVARAYGFGPQADSILAQADKNKDSFIQDTEFASALTLGSTAANAAREIEAKAAAAAAPPPGPPANAPPAVKVLMNFKANDANKDGKLSKEEYQALAKSQNIAAEADAIWKSANKDNDAFITESELIGSLNAQPGVRIMTAGGPPATPEQRMAAFAAQDKNKDGKLTKEEFAEVLKALNFTGPADLIFTQRDTDKDGFVSEAEFKAPATPMIVQRPQ